MPGKAKSILSAVRENDIIVMEDCGFSKMEASRGEIICSLSLSGGISSTINKGEAFSS